jgi:hypothetical protein
MNTIKKTLIALLTTLGLLVAGSFVTAAPAQAITAGVYFKYRDANAWPVAGTPRAGSLPVTMQNGVRTSVPFGATKTGNFKNICPLSSKYFLRVNGVRLAPGACWTVRSGGVHTVGMYVKVVSA